MAKNNRGRNNNPEGRNQFSNSWVDTARERPLAAAAAGAAAAAAGVFLWSKRSQITDQLSQLTDQVGEWTNGMRSGSEESEFEMAGTSSSGTTSTTQARRGKPGRSTGMSQTGGGNASLGAQSGGSGMHTGASGRTGA